MLQTKMDVIPAVNSSGEGSSVVILHLDINGIALMQRDLNLIRRIFREIQERKDARPRAFHVDGEDEARVLRHVDMLIDAGLIDGKVHTGLSGNADLIVVEDLTWQGHDLAAALSNETVLGQIKSKLSPAELATLPLSLFKTLAIGLLESYAKAKLGLL